MKFFSADDFAEQEWQPISSAQAANIANQKLQRDAKVVYICEDPRQLTTIHFPRPVDATHTGLLICVEKIERKPCEHDPVAVHNGVTVTHGCRYCGVKLKAKWEVVG